MKKKTLQVLGTIGILAVVAIAVVTLMAALKPQVISGEIPLRGASILDFKLHAYTLDGKYIHVPVEGVSISPGPAGRVGTYISVERAEQHGAFAGDFETSSATILTSNGEYQAWQAAIQKAVAAKKEYHSPRVVTPETK